MRQTYIFLFTKVLVYLKAQIFRVRFSCIDNALVSLTMFYRFHIPHAFCACLRIKTEI